MTNKIITKYQTFKAPSLKKAQKIINNIAKQNNFKPEKLLYTGKILHDKIATIIYSGQYGDKNLPAILKVIFINQETPEPEIIQKFNNINKPSKKDIIVRFPKIYKYQPYSTTNGYMYHIMEQIEGEQLEELPIFDKKIANHFIEFYKAYKTQMEPLFPPTPEEFYSLSFILARFFKWLETAKAFEPITKSDYALINQFVGTTGNFLQSWPMRFLHRHLRPKDCVKITTNTNQKEFIILAPAFLSYMPEFYDLTFHLWQAIEFAHRVPHYQKRKVSEYLDYIKQWLKEYKNNEIITNSDQEKAFWALIAERATGALIIDQKVRKYKKTGEERTAYDHLQKVWTHIFDYSLKSFKNI